MKCFDTCNATGTRCPERGCRLWMDHEEDLNCTIIAVKNNKEGMSICEISKRLNVSWATANSLEQKALKKMAKGIRNTP